MPETPTKEEVTEYVRRLLPELDPDSGFRETAELIVFAGLANNYSNTWLAQVVGRSRGWVISREKNLKASGVWLNGKVEARWMDSELDPYSRGVELMVDIKIAEGLIEED